MQVSVHKSQTPPTGPSMQVDNNNRGPWSTGLCDCFTDVPSCCLTYWCPCITFGRIAEIVDKGSTSCGASCTLYACIAFAIGCACIYSCSNTKDLICLLGGVEMLRDKIKESQWLQLFKEE